MSRTLIERLGFALILLIPLGIVALFWRLEVAPQQSSMAARPPGAVQVAPHAGEQADANAQLEQLTARLAERLEREPGDAEGWGTLARTYYVMRRFPEAVAAYEKLDRLGPLDADVLADYADAAAMAQGRRLEGRPMQLVQRSLAQDPMQWKALSMVATDALERGDLATAIDNWERALGAVAADSEIAESIRGSLAQAREAMASSNGASR